MRSDFAEMGKVEKELTNRRSSLFNDGAERESIAQLRKIGVLFCVESSKGL